MENLLTAQNLFALVSLIIYGVVFFIQKAQFKKQDGILNKYEKVFAIFNIDEIEKYVELQKKSTELALKYREGLLTEMEDNFQLTSKEAKTLLNDAKNNLAKSEGAYNKSKELNSRLQDMLKQNDIFMKEMTELNILEFKELHQIIEIFKEKNPIEYANVSKRLVENIEKYSILKNELLEKMN